MGKIQQAAFTSVSEVVGKKSEARTQSSFLLSRLGRVKMQPKPICQVSVPYIQFAYCQLLKGKQDAHLSPQAEIFNRLLIQCTQQGFCFP